MMPKNSREQKLKSQSVIGFGNILDLLDAEQFPPGMNREFHWVDHALESTKGMR